MKKYILTIAMILGLAVIAFSQKVTDKKIDVDGKITEMKLDFADNITIEAWNNNYIELHASANIEDNQYNDFYELNVNEKSGKIEIEEKVDFEGIKKKIGTKNLNNFNTEINYKLKIPKTLNFDVNTISGEIELIGCEGEMTVNSVSGFIDYSIPEKHKTKIDLSTVTGNVYTNVKFDNPLPKEISWVGTNSELTLNGGDKDVELKTVSGDIYLRKF
jgi:hypothetical protein